MPATGRSPGGRAGALRRYAFVAHRDSGATASSSNRDRGFVGDALGPASLFRVGSCAIAAGTVERIVEVTDASPEELEIQEGNTGVYQARPRTPAEGLATLATTTPRASSTSPTWWGPRRKKGHRVEAMKLENARECLGINTRAELAQATAELRRRTAQRLMAGGVTDRRSGPHLHRLRRGDRPRQP